MHLKHVNMHMQLKQGNARAHLTCIFQAHIRTSAHSERWPLLPLLPQDGYGWFGQMSSLEPGQGYMMKLAKGGSATFTA